jgi:hypothetical protein
VRLAVALVRFGVICLVLQIGHERGAAASCVCFINTHALQLLFLIFATAFHPME